MPVVWRTILVRPETRLEVLHRYVQAAMGWDDCHRFAFTIGANEYGIPDRAWPSERKVYDARRYTLARLFPSLPTSFAYLYDFGDTWEHAIDIEGEQDAEYRKQYPVCIAGGESCPPEDCGGPSGYRELLSVLGDVNHPEHAEWKAWAEGRWYPTRFSPQLATSRMRIV